MLALAQDSESRLFKCLHRVEMIDAGEFGHQLNGDFDFADLAARCDVCDGPEVLLDGGADVLERLGLS
jgi:hypothetical protein